MLELTLLRHAKSDWDASFERDRDRPLNKRGRRAARAVGAYLAHIDKVPELILCSPALRAATTAELASESGSWSTPIRTIERLYSGGPGDLMQAVQTTSDVGRLMVVGHQPTLSTVASRFVGGGSIGVPTAALVTIRFRVDAWPVVGWGRGDLRSVTLARDLVAAGFGPGHG